MKKLQVWLINHNCHWTVTTSLRLCSPLGLSWVVFTILDLWVKPKKKKITLAKNIEVAQKYFPLFSNVECLPQKSTGKVNIILQERWVLGIFNGEKQFLSMIFLIWHNSFIPIMLQPSWISLVKALSHTSPSSPQQTLLFLLSSWQALSYF